MRTTIAQRDANLGPLIQSCSSGRPRTDPVEHEAPVPAVEEELFLDVLRQD